MTRAVFAHSSRAVAGIRGLGYCVLVGALAFGIGFAVARGVGVTAGVVVSVLITAMAGWRAPPILSRVREAAVTDSGHEPRPPRRRPQQAPR
jgi:hypothetical protein